ncbi:cytochrome BD ubiquinol oxidase subunit II [Aquabacterium fontiphilum]|jgi:cytochrome d ubiquinol oxidase subunit II|uniref:cytochrome d ubiquinol oxidase subunit II n=1 Tax=Aquabacterium fontiphilum TaxID=450365 RepID=UPI001377D0E7|nr:cytochrome d ubiquinol oxidase subunit II [Aquabacterium fontiphilum]NBD21995.1 cytochrome BD ubiquinol oxidase subunit II [Aquabacterium fontiphilum]
MITEQEWMPVVFWLLMGVAMLAYVVLDGYDLGVGMLMPWAREDADKDMMVASIGPFWDANETWLVLGVGLLLVAFPKGQGVVLGALYLPVAVMLVGLILRGVAFDFRVKARAHHKPLWNRLFSIGSLLAATAQGWMLGRFVMGLESSPQSLAFAALIAVALPITYALLGACWLILKTEGDLQRRAVSWAKVSWPAMVIALLAISVATPWFSETVRARWFSFPNILALLPIPLMSGLALVALRGLLNSHRIVGPTARLAWLPLVLAISVMLVGGMGLAYSLYPYIVLDQITVWDAAAAPSSLWLILIGTSISLPAIAAYTFFVYRVFGGKATALSYG